MICPKCKKEDPEGREMCPYCGAPIIPIPVPSGGKIRFGKYDWFVLDKQDDRMLIITEKVIEKRPYHHEECEVTWEICDMRKYLNNEFYNSFNKTDRERMVEVVNENNDNSWYGTRGGNTTTDKIFLLSVDEVIKYFGDSGQIRTRYMYPNCDWCNDEYLPWIDDKYSLNRRAVDDTGVVRSYKLRSPGCNEKCVTNVMGFCGDGHDQGSVSISGNCELSEDGHFSFDSIGDLNRADGVRPAMWVRI